MGISAGVVPNGDFVHPSGKTSYQKQEFKADVDIKPNEEGGPSSVTLSNIREVKAITVADGDDGDITTPAYPTFDITAVQLRLATGATVFIEVRPGDGIPLTPLTYNVNSLDKDPENGAVTFNAWDIRRSIIPPSAMLLFGANVSVIVVPSQDGLTLPYSCNSAFCRKVIGVISRQSGSETGKLTIAYASGGDAPGTANNDLVKFFLNLSGLIKRRVPVEIRAKRAGCKNVKRMIAYIDRVSVDGKRIELKISKKGLKSKGCAAKKAVDGFKNGEYELESIRWAWRKRLIAPGLF